MPHGPAPAPKAVEAKTTKEPSAKGMMSMPSAKSDSGAKSGKESGMEAKATKESAPKGMEKMSMPSAKATKSES